MYVALVLLCAMLFPVLALALLLLLAHLEDTLPRDVGLARRQPPPPPILAIEVRADAGPVVVPQPLVPAQRTAAPPASIPASLADSLADAPLPTTG
jgi:hypothetical protein